jgi:hypothetical protein
MSVEQWSHGDEAAPADESTPAGEGAAPTETETAPANDGTEPVPAPAAEVQGEPSGA